MKRLAVLCCLLVLVVSCPAADPPPAPPVILPDVQPVPPPVPSPTTPQKLAADQLYVVRSDLACTILCSPDGVVKVSRDAGPVKIKARFVGGSGTYECKTFSEKNVWSIEAAQTGPCELIIVEPDGTILRRSLDVSAAPAPPIPPGPGPGPTDPLTVSLQTAYASEADPAKATKLTALADYYGAVIAAAKTDASVTSLATLQTKIHAGADLVTGAGGLPALRKVAGAYVAGKLPATDQPMTADLWATAAGAYSDLSKALKGVK